jgi:2-iminobutanoate/2-iminopropanoate deaminase
MHKSVQKKQQQKQKQSPVAKTPKRKVATKKVVKKRATTATTPTFTLPSRQFSALERVNTENAPAAVGPYSQAIKAKGTPVFISGQLPLDPKTMKFNSETDVSLQTEQCLVNMKAILQAGGLEMNNVVKTTILLKDMGDFAKVNKVYATFFQEPFPARACYQVAALPLGAMVEIEAVAVDKGAV